MPTNHNEYLRVFELERESRIDEAGNLLNDLAVKNDANALIELGWRYSLEKSDPDIYWPGYDFSKSTLLIDQGRDKLLHLANAGDPESMRMLGYFYLGYLAPVKKDIPEAERWLLKSYESGCYIAANDLSVLYVGAYPDLARYWYEQALLHDCCVITPPDSPEQ